MAAKIQFGGVELNAGTQSSPAASTPQRDTPFHILILGDFSARGHRGLDDPDGLGKRKPVMIDVDNEDEVFRNWKTEIALSLEAGSTNRLTVSLGEQDDLHPDRLFETVELFDALRAKRRQLLNPATFQAAAAALLESTPTAPAAEISSVPNEPPLAAGDLLDAALAATPDVARSRRDAPLVDQLIQEIVAPYVLPAPDPRQPELVASVDSAIAGLMRAILHAPAFQECESLWRCVHFLLRRISTSRTLKIFLLDITRHELKQSLQGDAAGANGLARVLRDSKVGEVPWSLLTVNALVSTDHDDLELLGRLAQTAQQMGTPVCLGGTAQLVGCPSFATTPDSSDWGAVGDAAFREAWDELRNSAAASHVNLTVPRFLLRRPYGRGSDPIESFDFEEFSDTPSQEQFVWGNSAFIATCALAQQFSDVGWRLNPGTPFQLDRLPMHVYREDGEMVATPCGEAWITEPAAQKIGAQGLTPILSVRGADAVYCPGLRSLRSGRAALAGGWS